MPIKDAPFTPLNIAVVTLSDSRDEATDTSGQYLAEALVAAGHKLRDKQILPDCKYRLRALVSQWLIDDNVQVIITNGGTGITGRDTTPEAIAPLLDRDIAGFGELFRQLSYDSVGTSTMQSRAVAGIANGRLIFCLPGSTGACRDGWEQILRQQLDSRHGPCNLAELLPRLQER